MVDQETIDEIKAGSDKAFRLLVDTYRHDLFRAVFAILRNQKDAEDATQEAFVKIYHSLSEYEGLGLKTWLTRIAVNHAIDVKRKHARRKEEVTNEMQEQSRPDDTAQHVIRLEQKRLVHQKLAELPIGYREMIVDFYIREKTYQQIAEEHEMAVKNVEIKLYRARKWMKKHWKEDEFS